MAKKGKGFWGSVGSFFGSIPAVKSVKKAAKSVKKKLKKAKKKIKKAIKKAKKKLKKKIGKVFTKARKLKNKLSKSKLVKKFKRAAKKVVRAGKKVVKKAKKYTKAAVKKTKKYAKAVVKTTKKAAKKVGGKIATAYNSFKEGGYKEVISAAVDCIPIVGNVKAAYETVVGKDPITGRKLDKMERVVSGAAILGGPAVKMGKRAGGVVSGIVAGGKKGKNTPKPKENTPKPKENTPKPKENTPKPKENNSKNLGKDGLTSDQRKEYKEKIKELENKGNQKGADKVRYERYKEGKQNLGKTAKPPEKWNEDLTRVRKNQQRGSINEKYGREALDKHLGDQVTLVDNNKQGKIVTHTSTENVTTRPDSIGYKDDKIYIVHDHKHFTGKGDQVISNDKQMRAQRELTTSERTDGRHIVTMSSDNAALNNNPPRPRPSKQLGQGSEIYYTSPESGEITHQWVKNRQSKVWEWEKLK